MGQRVSREIMHIDQIKTFLEVAASGNFNRAAERLNVTQSTVSARIRTLEERLGRPLFERDHAGAKLTSAGERLHRYALSLQRLWQRAEQEVALPAIYRGVLGLGAQASLWERLILRWIRWMRCQASDVAIRAEADYSTSIARQVADGALDIGVVYTPGHRPGLVVEELFVDQLVLVSTDAAVSSRSWQSNYIFVDWGQAYNIAHAEAFPDLKPAVSVGLGPLGLRYMLDNGGAGYFPLRVIRPYLSRGELHQVPSSPVMQRPAYIVYNTSPLDKDLLHLGLRGLREIALQTREDSACYLGNEAVAVDRHSALSIDKFDQVGE